MPPQTAAADNHGYVPSPKIPRSSESNIDRWAKISEPHQMKSPSLKVVVRIKLMSFFFLLNENGFSRLYYI